MPNVKIALKCYYFMCFLEFSIIFMVKMSNFIGLFKEQTIRKLLFFFFIK